MAISLSNEQLNDPVQKVSGLLEMNPSHDASPKELSNIGMKYQTQAAVEARSSEIRQTLYQNPYHDNLNHSEGNDDAKIEMDHDDRHDEILMMEGKREKKLLQELVDNKLNDDKQPQDSERDHDASKHKIPIQIFLADNNEDEHS